MKSLMNSNLLILVGPLLFLVAQLLAPSGSPDPAQRQAIIAGNQAAWELSHQIFAIAFVFLLWWLLRLWARLKDIAMAVAGIGAFVTGFALLADFGIATLQFVALEAVRSFPEEQALAFITVMSNSQNLQTFVYLPYLGFVIGLGLLGWGVYRQKGQGVDALLLALTGVLLVVGGMTGLRLLLIGAGGGWVIATLLWLRTESDTSMLKTGQKLNSF